MALVAPRRSSVERRFESLYRRHAPDVYRYALAVMHNAADAEDVTQTTFMHAFRAMEQGEEPINPHNWLVKIAHNVCRQKFRLQARRPAEVPLTHDVGDGVVTEDDVPSAADIFHGLRHLTFNQRAALVMRELQGRTYAEIAQILGLSRSAVETLIFRARGALREQLEGAITCREAELAIARRRGGLLSAAERRSLRAHLRECADCASLARSARAQRRAWKSIGSMPLPQSLTNFAQNLTTSGGALTDLAAKAAVVVAAGLLVGGAGYEAVSAAGGNRGAGSGAVGAAAEELVRGRLVTASGAKAKPSESKEAVVGEHLAQAKRGAEAKAAAAAEAAEAAKASEEEKNSPKKGAIGKLVGSKPVGGTGVPLLDAAVPELPSVDGSVVPEAPAPAVPDTPTPPAPEAPELPPPPPLPSVQVPTLTTPSLP